MPLINICHLYPDHLNLYGDRGNMISLTRRAGWHGIDTEVIPVKPGSKIDFTRCDLLFMGGGQDSDQRLVAEDFMKRRSEMKKAVDNGMTVFAVCGSYQLLGHYYKTPEGEKISGLEIMDLYTEAGPARLIGNAVIACGLWEPSLTLVGFENHAGLTFLGSSLKPLGTVINGFGNNGSDNTEGAVYKNVIGTYLHGSLLPKNPWLTDYLIQKALDYRSQHYQLRDLDDSFEITAHQTAIRLAGSRRHKRLSTRA